MGLFYGENLKREKVLLGTCSKVHGIKGAVVFSLFNAESSILKKGMQVFDEKENLYKIKNINFTNKVIVELEGIEDRNKAEALVPFQIYANRSDFPKLDEDEVYLSDIIGFKVFNTENKEVGVINSFYDHGAGEVAVILLKSGEELELPFVKAFFPDIDFNKNSVCMINPEII